ncbi:MAG: LysM peptidoglycan-binding domain-containing protein [Candidatus Pacebacteria bacterium]|nr:LysM peptidoglycan-binding domain-containing protein [Candidatus Paceibacterota bacterium]
MKVYYFIHYYINKIAVFLQKIFLFLFKKIDRSFFVFRKQTELFLNGTKNEKDVFLLSYVFVFCCICAIIFYVTDFAKPKDFLIITEKALVKNVQVDKSMACLSCMDAYAMEIEAKPEDFLEVYLIKDISFLQDETLKDTLSENLPKQKTDLMTYTVKQGDTLSTIASKFGIDVSTLKGSNELGSVLTVGQELVILPVSGSYYTVKQGDTLSTIATKNDISINSIIEYNDIRGVEIFVGQKLILPGAKAVPRASLGSAGYFMQPTTG